MLSLWPKLIEKQTYTMHPELVWEGVPTPDMSGGDDLPPGFQMVPDNQYPVTRQSKILGVEPVHYVRWLPYIPGKVSCVPLKTGGDKDVLTLSGTFSGCYLVIFDLKKTGKRYAGHIATNEMDLLSTLSLGFFTAQDLGMNTTPKHAYLSAIGNDEIRHVKGFRPHNPPRDLVNYTKKTPMVYGCITPFTENLYTIVMTGTDTGPPTNLRVAAVVRMQNQPFDANFI